MPFKSKRQLSLCYSKQLSAKAKGKNSSWDCDEWLSKSKDPQCLPTLTNKKKTTKCRPLRNDEQIYSPVYRGERGGMYFYRGGVKIYVPKNAKKYVEKHYDIKNE